MGQLDVVLGEAARGMCGQNQRHLVPTDVDVGVMVHELRLVSDLIHEVQGCDKVGQLVRRGNRRFIAIGAAPVRQSRQLAGHFGISQEWAHSLSQGAAAVGVKSRALCVLSLSLRSVHVDRLRAHLDRLRAHPHVARPIASSGTTGRSRERKPMVAIPESIKRVEQRPWIAHMIRTVERYISRLGSQFAAATTYFSVLAIVPIMMVAFSITGFVLTVVQPGLVDDVADAVAKALGGADAATRDKILKLVNDALSSFWTIGIVGLVAALYTGAKWMGHLKNAVRTQWRPGFDLRPQKINIVLNTLGNLLILAGFLVGMAVSFGLASLSTSFANTVVEWLGLSDQPWIAPLLRISSIVISIGTGWLIFMYLYTVLPETREPWRVVRRGALLGSIALVALQFVASILISAFRGNPAAVIFGPVIVLMLFFNLFAQLVLFVAAWIATAQHEAVPVPPDEEMHTSLAPESQEPEHEGPDVVPEAVAVRSVRVGMGAGYVTGAATGVGLGAALAYALSAAVRGRKKS